MALDFPANPTNGQTYLGYTYNSTTGAWLSNSSSVAPVYMGDIPPTNPTSGNMWFNTTDGTLYLYYYDGNSYQWVEARAPITSDGYYSPNYVINGGMDIAQRGTSFSLASGGGTRYFGADRFWTHNYTWSAGSNVTVSNDSSTYPVGAGVSSSYKVATGATGLTFASGGHLKIVTTIEGEDVARAYGKVTTLSFWVRSSIAGTYNLWLGNGNFDTGTATRAWTPEYTINQANTWERKTVTVDLSTVTQSSVWDTSNGYGIQLVWVLGANADRTADSLKTAWSVPSGYVIKTTTSVNWATNANATFYLTGVQLEDGNIATPFRRNAGSIQGELAACQRYFQAGVPAGTGRATSATIAEISCALPVVMRVTPTITHASNYTIVQPGIAFASVTNSTLAASSANGVNIQCTSSSLGTGAIMCMVPQASGGIWLSAEL